jgi:hypothetical protein
MAFIFRQSFEASFGALPVRYQPSVPLIPIADRERLPLPALVKGVDWLYEKEWRLVESKRARSWKELHSSALHGVVFGARCSDDDIDFIRELTQRRASAGHPPLCIYAAKIDSKKYELDFDVLGVDGWTPAVLP